MSSNVNDEILSLLAQSGMEITPGEDISYDLVEYFLYGKCIYIETIPTYDTYDGKIGWYVEVHDCRGALQVIYCQSSGDEWFDRIPKRQKYFDTKLFITHDAIVQGLKLLIGEGK